MCVVVVASIRCRKCQYELRTETRHAEGICETYRAMRGTGTEHCPRFQGEQHIFEKAGLCGDCEMKERRDKAKEQKKKKAEK
jgi:hypothetical protein